MQPDDYQQLHVVVISELWHYRNRCLLRLWRVLQLSLQLLHQWVAARQCVSWPRGIMHRIMAAKQPGLFPDGSERSWYCVKLWKRDWSALFMHRLAHEFRVVHKR